MVTIIAEKPSAARDLARIVGATVRCDGYLTGNGYNVTWAFGHLVSIFAPEAEGAWFIGNLPILPPQFFLQAGMSEKGGRKAADEGYVKQLGIIRKLFDESEYIINAGDAGREGELIQRYIYAYVGCSKPVKRLWTSSLTDAAIKEGLANLMDSKDFDNLYYAGKARNEADWLVGINATRALTLVSGGRGKLLSLGRVQTPTLAMVCKRYLENKDFVPQTFWNLKVAARKDGTAFAATAKERYYDVEKLNADIEKIAAAGQMTVTKMEKKERALQPPYLHDLTSLQKEANRKYNLSAQDCLDIAQSLYEKKLLTYPRTGSKFIPDDVYAKVPGLIELQGGHRLYGQAARAMAGQKLNRHSVDKTKVTDHHALLPTEIMAIGLSDLEQKVYDLVVVRMLEAMSPQCDMLSTSVEFDAAGVSFGARGNVILKPGWKAVQKEKDEDEDNQQLPSFTVGEVIKILKIKPFEGKTKPRPLHTEASLLEAMEHAGKEVDENDLKDALKDVGIGTPATRASEIETIMKRGYVRKEKKSLIPTDLGLEVYEKVKDSYIADVRLTGQWEKALSDIVDGKTSPIAFDKSIRRFTVALTDELLGRTVRKQD